MRDTHYLLITVGSILATATGTKDLLLPLLPALPLPDAKPTPEYKPSSVCQNLTMDHTGFNATQESGDALLCQPSPAPTQSTNIAETTNQVVKTTTTNTTITEVRTITTTTTTTIEATTTSSNTTVPMDAKPCLHSEGANGTQYNWWQVSKLSPLEDKRFESNGTQILITAGERNRWTDVLLKRFDFRQILQKNGGKPRTTRTKNTLDTPASDSYPTDPCICPSKTQKYPLNISTPTRKPS